MLNTALRGELAAVNAYQHALRSLKGRAGVNAVESLHFASEPQRSAAVLEVTIRGMGGVPASEAATRGFFAVLGDQASARELLDWEEAVLRMYEAAKQVLDGDARDLVTFDLVPRQLRNITELTAIISRLTA